MTFEVRLDDPDLRLAGGLLLGCAAARAAVPGDVGVPCPLRTLTGVPCPLCGLTTSVTAAISLDIPAALAANPAGPLLLILALVLVVGCARGFVLRSAGVYLALSATWAWELHRFSII